MKGRWSRLEGFAAGIATQGEVIGGAGGPQVGEVRPPVLVEHLGVAQGDRINSRRRTFTLR